MTYRDRVPVSSSKNRFSEVMSRCGDIELVGIVEGPPDDWEPEALAAAQLEIERRAMSIEVLEEITSQIETSSAMARSPLPRGGRALAFVAGVFGVIPGLLGAYVYTRYQRKGYPQKARDLVRWFAYGVGIHILALLLAAVGR